MTGKRKCEWLKHVRARIAEINGIEYHHIYECKHEGECPGFCPICDKEAEDLMIALSEKEQKGDQIKIDLDILDQLEAISKEPTTDDEPIVLSGCVMEPGIETNPAQVIDDSYMDWN